MLRAYRQQGQEPENLPWVEELLKGRASPQEDLDDPLYCFVCGRVITRLREKISVQGAHEHTFTNPGGYVYDIGCFRDAEGCEEAGSFTQSFTWFAGYGWRYAGCRDCRVHLGWAYQGGSEEPQRFFGLIRNRLVSSRTQFPSLS